MKLKKWVMKDSDDDIMTSLSSTFSSNLKNSQNSKVGEMETFKSLSFYKLNNLKYEPEKIIDN